MVHEIGMFPTKKPSETAPFPTKNGETFFSVFFEEKLSKIILARSFYPVLPEKTRLFYITFLEKYFAFPPKTSFYTIFLREFFLIFIVLA